MLVYGMGAALLAGVFAALSTYAAQSIVYQDAIRGSMSGARLWSSTWNRCQRAQQILDGKHGRERIFIFQLQGHIFFGNVTKMVDDIKCKLKEKQDVSDEPAVGEFKSRLLLPSIVFLLAHSFSFAVILDFTNTLGLDSSAAQSITKLKVNHSLHIITSLLLLRRTKVFTLAISIPITSSPFY